MDSSLKQLLHFLLYEYKDVTVFYIQFIELMSFTLWLYLKQTWL